MWPGLALYVPETLTCAQGTQSKCDSAYALVLIHLYVWIESVGGIPCEVSDNEFCSCMFASG